ncbi:MAG TPA: O-antigen ligase family protein [Saprospiraceae bacterium]|nr:O-antigen ligase family protein [Saprospiraceae bacterium]
MSIRQKLAIYICVLLASSLVWSYALVSIGMVMLAIVAAIDIQTNPFKIKWLLTPDLIRVTIRYKPFMWVFALFALLYMVSIVYAGNIREWWGLTHRSLSFLLIPMSFAMLKPFNRNQYMLVTLSMVVVAFLTSIWVLLNFYQHHDYYVTEFGKGGVLPTPVTHIRYSMIIASSLILCLFFAIENWKLKYAWERRIYAGLAIYFFIFLHIASVRTGLAVAYAGILILLIFYLKRISASRKIALAAIVIIAPLIAYTALPGFKQKINYTIWDFKQFMKGEGNTYSDSERWESWKVGMEVGKQHLLFGTGTGHFRSEVKSYYNNVLQKEKWTRPHNQFINVFVIFGFFGFAVFVFMLIYPMTFKKFWSIALIPTLYLMQILSLMVEHPLDTEIGAGLFLLLTMLGLSLLDDEKFGALT